MSYQNFKSSVYNKIIGDGQCVALIVNNSKAYAEYLFPGITWTTIFPPVPAAKQLLDDANPKYFEKIINNHNDPNQLPIQGDIMVFDATPKVGYTNNYNNPYGHVGICESAYPTGYVLLQQNSPYEHAPVNSTHYDWKYRPCLGWLRPIMHVPVNTPKESNVQSSQTIAQKQSNTTVVTTAPTQATATLSTPQVAKAPIPDTTIISAPSVTQKETVVSPAIQNVTVGPATIVKSVQTSFLERLWKLIVKIIWG